MQKIVNQIINFAFAFQLKLESSMFNTQHFQFCCNILLRFIIIYNFSFKISVSWKYDINIKCIISIKVNFKFPCKILKFN